jgi:DNA-directed RNA polymerase specialized sigma24 family protein
MKSHCQHVIDEVTAQVCRRHRLSSAEAEDFRSEVGRHFVQRDFEALRRFERRSSLRTYLTVVICRLFLNYRHQLCGANDVRADHEVLATRVQLAVDRVSRALEPEVRLILKMRFDDRFAIADIARALHRGRALLRRRLADTTNDPPGRSPVS